MALKDIWTPLQDAVAGVPKSGSDVSVKPINDIADAVIDLEKKGEQLVPITIDSAMSDTSENAVQNKVIKGYVDNITGNLSAVLDELHNYAQAIINGGAV